MNLILNELTDHQLNSLISNPSHAIGLEAPNGMGKATVAEYLFSKFLDLEQSKLVGYPYFLRIVASGSSISIEQVREVQHFLELKTIGDKPIRRAVLVEHAEALTNEAQNALLKTLEEPPADTVIVLTIANSKSLLPTITSRIQIISIKEPSKSQLETYFSEQGLSKAKFEQIYTLSGGLPGIMTALTESQKDNPLLASTDRAKSILRASKFDRLIMVDELSKSKETTLNLLQALSRIAYVAIGQAAKGQDKKSLRRWQQIMTTTYDSQRAMDRSAQAKLVLTNLMLNI